MNDLTEQWKKGELPKGWYWVDYYSVDGTVMLEYIPQHNGFGYEEKELVQAVLAEVPDYVEWRNMVNCACEEHEANKRFIEENAQLKELLKECELWFTGIVGNMNDKNVGEHNRSLPIGNFEYTFKVFSQKINEVLK